MPLLNTISGRAIVPGQGVTPVENFNILMLDSTAAGLTATPSGTQITALVLTARANSISTVVTAGDAVCLPPALAGMAIKVRNGAANAMDVFPASAAQGGATVGDQINALGANTAYSQATGTVTFTCYVTGQWETV